MEEMVFKRDEISPGETKKVKVGMHEIVVVCTQENQLFAVSNRCPHQGAELKDGHFGFTTCASEIGKAGMTSNDNVIRCPWHGYEFDVTSGCSLTEPDRTKIRTYKVKIEGDSVIIKTR